MTTHRDKDPIERLSDADPVSDHEVVGPEAQREADALLARVLAAPSPDAEPRRRSWIPLRRDGRPRRALVLVAGIASCIVVALATIDLTGSDDSSSGIVEKAIAATTSPDVIYHTVELFTVRFRTEDPRILDAFDFDGLDAFEERSDFHESWMTPSGRSRLLRFEAQGRRRGRLLTEVVTNGDVMRQFDAKANQVTSMRARYPSRPRRRPTPPPGVETVPQVNPAQDAGPQLRKLQEEGRLKLAGTTQVRGRRAFRLESDVIVDPNERGHTEQLEFLVDARTYLPLRQRQISTQLGIAGLPPDLRPAPEFYATPVITIATREFLVYEKLPRTPENLAELRFARHPGAKVLPEWR